MVRSRDERPLHRGSLFVPFFDRVMEMRSRGRDSKRDDRVLLGKSKWKESGPWRIRKVGGGGRSNDICSLVVADLNNGPA